MHEINKKWTRIRINEIIADLNDRPTFENLMYLHGYLGAAWQNDCITVDEYNSIIEQSRDEVLKKEKSRGTIRTL